MSAAPLDPHEVDADAPTPADLIAQVRAAKAAADEAALRTFDLALAWAHSHPAIPGDGSWHAPRLRLVPDRGADDGAPASDDLEAHEWFGIPDVAWDAVAPFAAANAMSTAAGRAYLRDALVIRHRLPHLHARVESGHVPVWRARRIAQRVLGAPADVTAHVDQVVAPVAATAGLGRIDQVVEQAMLLLHAEEVELDSLTALEHRHATLDERTLTHTGIAEMTLRADWADLVDLDTALSRVADALQRDGSTESHDVRRSRAIGILADPTRALALLTAQPVPAPTTTVVAYVHLGADTVEGRGLLATDEHGHTLLAERTREWLARTDRHVVVRPVIDLTTHCPGGPAAGHTGHDPYVPTTLTAERVRLRNPTCVFPHCTRRSRACDLDHLDPHATSGTTCECNLAPLCRHHHRLKTHTGWTYQHLVPGTFLWREPHGQTFLTTPRGTTDLTDP